MNFDILNKFAKGVDKTKADGSLQNAIIYTRVSTKEQMDTNKSLDWQKTSCEKYSSEKGFRILEYFGGTYESAKSDERKEFTRMLKYVKSKTKDKISYIIVYSFDRFSRTGENAIYISSELKKTGVDILSATQHIDLDSNAGKFQQNIHFLFNQYDNDMRKQKCVEGMRSKLKRGEWLGNCPIGYSYSKESKQQTVVITKKGPFIKKAFQMRASGSTHKEIISYLKKHEIVVYKQYLSKIFKNPFYLGYIAHNFLDGKVIKGNHPALISLELFEQVNGIRKVNNVKQNKANDNLPLKGFVRDYATDEVFTGYLVKPKKLYYYKVNKIGIGVNRSQKMMHEKFNELLSTYSISAKFIAPLKKQLMLTWNTLKENHVGDKISQVKRLKAVEDKIQKIEERFAFGDIDKELFNKFHGNLKAEADSINKELKGNHFNLSNPEELITFALQLSSEGPSTWASGDFDQKQRLQELFFPPGIHFDAENNQYRTIEVNPIFSLIQRLSSDLEGNKKGTSPDFSVMSPSVHQSMLVPNQFLRYLNKIEDLKYI